MQMRDGLSPEVLSHTQMQVRTHNEQDGTLNKNDHAAAVMVQHCPDRLSIMHTICKTSRVPVHAHIQGLQGLQGKKASVKTFDC
eukprot:589740-Pelagomonas_calceolata.AAC.1